MKEQMQQKGYLLLGEDTWPKKDFVQQKKIEYLGENGQLMNYHLFIEKECQLESILAAAQTFPFFSEVKIIHIKDSGWLKHAKKAEIDKIQQLLIHAGTDTIWIVEETEVDKRSKLYKCFSTYLEVCTFDFPDEEELVQEVNKWLKQKGHHMDKQDITYFVRHMPQDRYYLFNELEKLSSYTEEKLITRQIIDALAVFSLEQRVFDMVKKMANQDATSALNIYHKLIEAKESPIGILVLIARHYRLLLQTKYLNKSGYGVTPIAKQLKVPTFAAKEMLKQSENYTFKQLEKIIEQTLQADQSIKYGKMESVKSIELLMLQILNA